MLPSAFYLYHLRGDFIMKSTLAENGTRPVIRYPSILGTLEERKKLMHEQYDKFEKDARAGKLCCISDLIGNAESIFIDSVKERK